MCSPDESHAPAGQAGRGRGARSDLASLQRKIRGLAAPRPLYTADSVRAVTALLHDWTGWLSQQTPFPDATSEAIRAARDAWKSDGLRLRNSRVRDDSVQILFEATPQVSPLLCGARAKGRLQHALRQTGTPVAFSRKLAFRSLGEKTRDIVEKYLCGQVRKERFVDPRFAAVRGGAGLSVIHIRDHGCGPHDDPLGEVNGCTVFLISNGFLAPGIAACWLRSQ